MDEEGCSVAGVGGCESFNLKPLPLLAGVWAEGVSGGPPLPLPVLRWSLMGAMIAGRRPASGHVENK